MACGMGTLGNESPGSIGPDDWMFVVVVVVMTSLIWLYTRQGGIKTVVWTDTMQTVCLFGALILIIYKVVGELGMTTGDAVAAIRHSELSQVFVFDDWVSKQNFWKQFLSGAFIAIVMTGLDAEEPDVPFVA